MAVITGTFVLRDGGGAQLSLSQQEISRIQVRIPEAQVFIADISGKLWKRSIFAQPCL